MRAYKCDNCGLFQEYEKTEELERQQEVLVGDGLVLRYAWGRQPTASEAEECVEDDALSINAIFRSRPRNVPETVAADLCGNCRSIMLEKALRVITEGVIA